jgi:hypothetical protein
VLPQFQLNTSDPDLLYTPSALEPDKDGKDLSPPLSSAPPVAPEKDEEEL